MLRALGLVMLCALVGCTPGPPPTFPVAGVVSLDGVALAEGEIYFSLPGDPPVICVIKDGRFEGKAQAGVHRIEICAYRPRPAKAEMPGMTLPPENYLPSRYNSESKLTAEVTASGPNQFEFAMKSK